MKTSKLIVSVAFALLFLVSSTFAQTAIRAKIPFDFHHR